MCSSFSFSPASGGRRECRSVERSQPPGRRPHGPGPIGSSAGCFRADHQQIQHPRSPRQQAHTNGRNLPCKSSGPPAVAFTGILIRLHAQVVEAWHAQVADLLWPAAVPHPQAAPWGRWALLGLCHKVRLAACPGAHGRGLGLLELHFAPFQTGHLARAAHQSPQARSRAPYAGERPPHRPDRYSASGGERPKCNSSKGRWRQPARRRRSLPYSAPRNASATQGWRWCLHARRLTHGHAGSDGSSAQRMYL